MKTSPKPFCFVVMPFAGEFDDIYQFGIKGACEDAGVYCERVDEQIFTESMLERIFNQISRADLIVADMTGKNPNVFYEVGYAHALGKRTVLLTQEANDIPFDLKHFPHIIYNGKINDLRSILSKRIQRLAFEKTSQQEYELGLEIYWRVAPLFRGNVVVEYSAQGNPGATLTINNNSAVTYAPGEFRVGLIVPPGFKGTDSAALVSDLPDGRHLHMLRTFDTLFPGASCPVKFGFYKLSSDPEPDFDVTVRLFSKAGYRDFPLRFKRARSTSRVIE